MIISYLEGLSDDLNDHNFDCLAAIRDEKQIYIKQMACDYAVPFICSGHCMYLLIYNSTTN